MNPFKKGDRVRFVDNELNRAEILGRWFMPENYLTVNGIWESGCLELQRDNVIEWSKIHHSRFELAEPKQEGVKATLKTCPCALNHFWLIIGDKSFSIPADALYKQDAVGLKALLKAQEAK